MDSVLSLTILLGALQGIILSVVLFRSKFNKTSNKTLAAAIAVVSTALFLTYLQLVLDYKDNSYLIKSVTPLSLIFIPLLYIYVKINTKSEIRVTVHDLKYFIPFAILFIYNIPFYFGQAENKISYFERENIFHSAYLSEQLEIVFISIVQIAFSVSMVSLVLNMRKNFEKEVSNYREELINLMMFIAWMTLAFTVTGLILSLLQISHIKYPGLLDYLTAIGSSLMIYFIGYYTISHPQVFTPLDAKPTPAPPKPAPAIKENLYDEYLEKIISTIRNEQLYKDPELTLQSLSEKINIPSYLISKVINSKTDLNFYNFINEFRIEEVKRELLNAENPQILQIAFDAGFNTKSSFYNYFKKHTGLSPKDFITREKSY